MAKKQKRYKVMLHFSGKRIFLTPYEMCYALLEQEIQYCIKENSFVEISCRLLYGWKGFFNYTIDKLIDEVSDNFTEPEEIKQLLIMRNERREREKVALYASIQRGKKESTILKIYNKIRAKITGEISPDDIPF